MSEQTWLKEFYPIPAYKCRGGIAAIQHSLRKWEGALEKNLQKHNLTKLPIEYNQDTCSLCIHYWEAFTREASRLGPCYKCPIYKATDGDCGNIYKQCKVIDIISMKATTRITPEPMIRLLKKTLKFYQDKQKKPVAKKEKSK